MFVSVEAVAVRVQGETGYLEVKKDYTPVNLSKSDARMLYTPVQIPAAEIKAGSGGRERCKEAELTMNSSFLKEVCIGRSSTQCHQAVASTSMPSGISSGRDFSY